MERTEIQPENLHMGRIEMQPENVQRTTRDSGEVKIVEKILELREINAAGDGEWLRVERPTEAQRMMVVRMVMCWTNENQTQECGYWQ